jgi:hypothetical protein
LKKWIDNGRIDRQGLRQIGVPNAMHIKLDLEADFYKRCAKPL